MRAPTFRGGIHPYDGKDLSMDKKTVVVQPKGDLVFPMEQHIGAPAKPVVAVGDHVLAGQKIAEAVGAISSNIISSVSGTVKLIEPRLTVGGAKVLSIIVTNDEKYETVPGFGTARDYTKLSGTQILEIIKEAGIVGMGGAGFPTHVKLAPKNPDKIEYVIVNGAECEPYLTSDYRMMLEEPQRLVGGLKVILKLFKNAKGVLAIEDNKPEAVKVLTALAEKEPSISVKVMKTKYPQGAERQVISVVSGRKINSSMLPADVGCIVDNVDTVISVYSAVCESTPLIRRILTLTGDAVRNPVNVNVRIGMHYAELLGTAGGFKAEPEKIISGGPMMGMAMFSLDIPVTKTSSSLLAYTKDVVAEHVSTACIHCGRCVGACPNHVLPFQLAKYVESGNIEGFESLNGMECCECGCCAYVCPAKIPLTQTLKKGKRTVQENRRRAAAKK